MGKNDGGGRNEQKRKQCAASEAEEQNQTKLILKELKSLPVARRPLDYDLRIKRLSGILKRKLQKSRKSETHSRKGKAGRR